MEWEVVVLEVEGPIVQEAKEPMSVVKPVLMGDWSLSPEALEQIEERLRNMDTKD